MALVLMCSASDTRHSPKTCARRWSHSFRASTSSKTSPVRFLRVLSTRRSRRKEHAMRISAPISSASTSGAIFTSRSRIHLFRIRRWVKLRLSVDERPGIRGKREVQVCHIVFMATRSLTTKAGVFVTEGADLRFEALSAPTDAELDVLLRKIARRLIRLLRPPADAPEPDALDFLESAVHLHANDRAGLARLLAYGARGPIALERLGTLPDGRLTYQLKHPVPDGRTELVLQATEFLRKLATLVPPPRRNLVRYHGFFAPHSALRAKVVVGASGCARGCSPDGPAPQPEPAAPAACAGSTEPRPPANTPPPP